MVLAAKGLTLSEKRLRRLCQWSQLNSASSTNVVAAARALGFIQSREDYELRLYDLRDEIRAGNFPIVGVDLASYGRLGQHAQVVVAITNRGVAIQDPMLGQFVTSPAVFEQAWRGSKFLAILIE
jgi:ABC-type bacteriocin/lantibiotic exporter with double-glycine peptidase domain